MNKRGVFLSAISMILLSLLFASNTYANSFSITTGNDPVLEINLSSNLLELNLTPKPNTPVFNTTNLTVTAGTNNLTGYTLYMNVDNPNLNRTESLANNTTPSINSLTSNTEGYTESTFTTNSWGYHLPGETNYFAIPTEQLQLSTSPEPVNENTTTITFASKVDMTLPAGSYTTNMTFYAVTNAPVPTMQDIDNWKDSLIADHSIKAQDTRDGKYYNVTKLSSDNRIWMTQNLDLSGGTTLTSADSNVTTDYTLPASSTAGFNEYSVAYVYNDSAYGGYYSYMAATAGTNPGTNDSTDINAPSDICPKGWRLPTKAEYDTLKSTYTTGATLTAAPWNGEYGGSYYNGTAYNVGSMGNYWTSTASYTNMAYIVSIEDAVVSIYDDSNYYGSSVRCLVRNPDTIITYNANGGTGTMPSQNLGEFGNGTLSTNTFTRNGYTFAGWNTAADGSGTPYSNGASYTGSSITLYAQWEHFKMQEVNTWKSTLSTGDVIQVVDTRDNTIYNVSKLADGNIWMLDNLALDLLDSTILNKMTPENTNATAASLTSLKSGNRANGDKYATAGVTDWTSAIEFSYSVPLTNITNKDIVPNHAPTNGKGFNKVGGYYNYCAASAGSYCYGNGTDYGTGSGNATEDICPAGWRMPTSNTTGEYAALANIIYGSTGNIEEDETAADNYRSALSLPLSGYFINGKYYSRNSYGYFWSSTQRSVHIMYNLYADTDEIRPSSRNSRNIGYTMRCLAK